MWKKTYSIFPGYLQKNNIQLYLKKKINQNERIKEMKVELRQTLSKIE